MWWTPEGERILQGNEAKLFREALAMVVDMVRDDAEGLCRFDAPPFDNLQPHQKLAVLAQVSSALLGKDQPMPKLTAALEAAVGAVYETIMLLVEMEVDQPTAERDSPTVRELVLAACQERGIDEPLDAQSEDLEEWALFVDDLAQSVLWDEDWRESETLLDVDPTAAGEVKAMLGIDEDYYIGVPPDPTEEEMKAVWVALRRLIDGSS